MFLRRHHENSKLSLFRNMILELQNKDQMEQRKKNNVSPKISRELQIVNHQIKKLTTE